MKTKITDEELQELESLEVRGGNTSDSIDQYECSNSADGCGNGTSQFMCVNSTSGCGGSSNPKEPTEN
jgi:hypothetical protein